MDTGNKKAKKLYHESIENLKNSIYLYKNEVFLILQMEKKKNNLLYTNMEISKKNEE